MKKVLIIIFLILICLFLYGHYIEPNNLKINNYTIVSNDIPESFTELKIIHFSDILYTGSNDELIEKTIDLINNQDPDIVIFTGDLLNSNITYTTDDFELLINYFSNIEANLFKFAVIGDNDQSYLEDYKDILYDSNFILLDNENKLVFYKDNTPINIIGLTDTSDISNLLESDVDYNYSLVITHEPDNLSKIDSYDIDIILSGHSLGGIINIPFYGGIIKRSGAKTYINDYYELNETELYVSNGIGYTNFAFRLFNTPSINVYRFKSQ